MALFDNNNVAYVVALLLAFVIFYFVMNYKMCKMVDTKLRRHEKKILKKISGLYKHWNADMQEQRFENRRMAEVMREREMMRHRGRMVEEDDEDSVSNIGGAGSGGNFAPFDDDDDE